MSSKKDRKTWCGDKTIVSRRFSIPKVQRSPSEGCRHVLAPDSRQARDIVRLLNTQVLDEQLGLEERWHVDKVCLVLNEKLQEGFRKKKQELKQELTKEPSESFAFGLTQSECEADAICSRGDFSFQSLNVPLGSVDQGVNVFSYSDVLLQWAEKKHFRSPCVVVYKILKGRTRTVTKRMSTKEPPLEPTPNAECHISSSKPSTSEPVFEQLSKSQIFLFEYDKEALPSKHPRHCLPYATITFVSRTSENDQTWTGNFFPCTRTTMAFEAESEHKGNAPVQSHTKEIVIPKQLDRKRKANESGCSPLTRAPRTKTDLGALPLSSVDICGTSTVVLDNKCQSRGRPLAKSVNGDEKENKVCNMSEEEPKTGHRPDCGRMNLSDRFSNFTPCQTKFDDPKLEEMRQKHLKAHEKLKAVRTDRIKNALLGFGSSSEDETFSTIQSEQSLDSHKISLPSVVPASVKMDSSQTNVQNKKRGQGKLEHLESRQDTKEHGLGSLKITITNSNNSQVTRLKANTGNAQPVSKQKKAKNQVQGKQTLKHYVSKLPVSLQDGQGSPAKRTKGDKHVEKYQRHSKSSEHLEDNLSKAGGISQAPKISISRDGQYSPSRGMRGSTPGQSSTERRSVSPSAPFPWCKEFLRHRPFCCGRGFSRSREYRVRGFCPGRARGKVWHQRSQYFESDATSRVFEAEEEVYKAAASNMEEPRQIRDHAEFALVQHSPDNEEIQYSRENEYRPAPYVRLQSNEHDPIRERDYVSSDSCSASSERNVTFPSPETLKIAASCGPVMDGRFQEKHTNDLTEYRRSLGLEEISSSDSGHSPEKKSECMSDNLEVQDMDIDESSRETVYRGSLSNSYWEDSGPCVGHAFNILLPGAVESTNRPHSVTNSECSSSGGTPLCYRTTMYENKVVTAAQNSGMKSVVASAPAQEAICILQQQIQEASTPDRRRVLQLALESFIQKCASEKSDCNPVAVFEPRRGEPLSVPEPPRSELLSSYMNDEYIRKRVAECLDHNEVSQEQANHSPRLPKDSTKEERTDTTVQRKKSELLFHGRPLIMKGEPHKIRIENIPCQNKPVDPRAALSALFGRKFEVELKASTWGHDKWDPPVNDPGNIHSESGFSRKEEKDATVSDRDPRLKKLRRVSQTTTCPSSRPQQTSSDAKSTPKENEVVALKQDVKTDQDSSNTPATHFLQKLQHVSNLHIPATRPDPSASSSTEASAKRPCSTVPRKSNSQDQKALQATDAEKSSSAGVQVNSCKPSGGKSRSRRYSSSSSCSGKSSVSWSSKSSHESRPHKGLSPSGSRSDASPLRAGSPKRSHRPRSPHRRRSTHRSTPPHRKTWSPARSSHSYHSRSSKPWHRSSLRRSSSYLSSPGKGYCQKASSRDDKHTKSSGENQSTCRSSVTREPCLGVDAIDDLYGISLKLSALRHSTNKATRSMSEFDNKTLNQSCFACLGQYDSLWKKATKTLESLRKRYTSASESEKAKIQDSIEEYEDISANVHLQLESLVRCFPSEDIEKAGIEDWNFRPLSGVPGLSEREHLRILQRIVHMYKRQNQTADLSRLVRKKVDLLKRKLISAVTTQPSTHPGVGIPQPLGMHMTQSQTSIPQHRHSNNNLKPGVLDVKPVPTVSVRHAQQCHILPDQTPDVRRVVMRNIKPETDADVDQRGFGASNPAPQTSGIMQRNI